MPPPAGPPAQYTDADWDVSVTLLGSVVALMGLLYVLESHRPTLRTGAWLAVSKALCCYMGVLLNMSLYGNICYWFSIRPPIMPPDRVSVALYILLFFFWWILKHVATAWSLGLIWESKIEWPLHVPTPKGTRMGWQYHDVIAQFTAVRSSANIQNQHLAWHTETVGTLLGFVSASASMQACASMQQMGRGTNHENLIVLGVMPFALSIMYVIFRFANRIRDWIAHLDNALHFQELAWGAYMDFQENKDVGLGLSHVMVQAIRFYATGEYPGVMGQTLPGQERPGLWLATLLLACGMIFALISCLSMWMPPRIFGRLKPWTKMSSSLAVAWCFFYAIAFTADRFFAESAFNHLVKTVVATIIGIGIMYNITYMVESFGESRRELAEMFQDLFVPVSVLIGFSWKDAWQDALKVVVSKKPFEGNVPQPVGMLIAAALSIAAVFPAWRRFVLPKTFVTWKKIRRRELMLQGIIKDVLHRDFAYPMWLDREFKMKEEQWTNRKVRHTSLCESLKSESRKIVYDIRDGVRDSVRAVCRGICSSGRKEDSLRPAVKLEDEGRVLSQEQSPMLNEAKLLQQHGSTHLAANADCHSTDALAAQADGTGMDDMSSAVLPPEISGIPESSSAVLATEVSIDDIDDLTHAMARVFVSIRASEFSPSPSERPSMAGSFAARATEVSIDGKAIDDKSSAAFPTKIPTDGNGRKQWSYAVLPPEVSGIPASSSAALATEVSVDDDDIDDLTYAMARLFVRRNGSEPSTPDTTRSAVSNGAAGWAQSPQRAIARPTMIEEV